MPPVASMTVHCTILRAHCAPGLGPSQCGASCYAWSTDTACAGTVSGEEGVLASRHPWASGACGPSLRAVGATKDLTQSQAMVKCSWVKNGLECGLRVQDQGGEGVMEIADTHQRPRKALQRQNLLSGLVMADSRAGGEDVFYDVTFMSREVP